jgi:hypothetical protein
MRSDLSDPHGKCSYWQSNCAKYEVRCLVRQDLGIESITDIASYSDLIVVTKFEFKVCYTVAPL